MYMAWLFTLTSFKFKVQKQSKTISTNRINANDSLHRFSPINSFLDYLYSTTVLTTVAFFALG